MGAKTIVTYVDHAEGMHLTTNVTAPCKVVTATNLSRDSLRLSLATCPALTGKP